MKKYIILVFAVFFVACQEKNEKIIESVKIWYYNGIFDRAVAVSCDWIVYFPEKVDTLDIIMEDGSYLPKESVILESIIGDKEILQEIAIELRKRKIIKEDYVDARMKCYINFTDGKTDSLCISSNPIYGLYNNKPIKLTNKLVYLFRKNCGFYEWIGVDYMKYLEELNDTTFVREKVQSRWGGEY